MALGLNNLRPAPGSTHKKKRVGRGPGSGLGKTSGKGHKGQKSRSGYSSKIGFEGGQMPLQRRLPKRGFTNIFKKQWIEISLAKIEENFNSGDEITPEILHQRGLIKKSETRSGRTRKRRRLKSFEHFCTPLYQSRQREN